MLNDISVELFLIDWTHPDAVRYDTLARLVQHATGAPVVLCITPHTSHSVIDSGMRCGASLAVEKPSSGADSFHISLSSLH
ncbi:hypothetical protein C7402_103205 [Paraburkholderia unamae]|uniref:Response regulatory domain-containing protein n=2 Tax=Paraburkholderia unamae TaxID=219649 RepID=A0ABX5KUQ6_9BURK|nr:hypothetical protein C7402_103205 [Paraburkholderia unamae]